MARRRHRKKKLPEGLSQVTIETLSHDGRGIAHVEGKVVFIDEALPGEIVKFSYTDSRRDYAEGKVENYLVKANERVSPRCEHFGRCGGCSFQHVADKVQIQFKQTLLIEQFNHIAKLDIPSIWAPLTGSHWGYRRKARMGVKYVPKKGRVLVGFRERRNPFLAEIESCPVMYPKIGQNLMALSAMIGSLTIKDKIPQIEVAIGDDICVLALRVLKMPSAEDLQRMRDFEQEYNINLCLQPKGPASIRPLPGHSEVIPGYTLADQGIHFKFKPTMFTQVNYAINQQMVSRAIDALALNKTDRVLDLFCGLGNFTLPMATQAGHVVGIEGDLPLVNQAKLNAQINQLDNVEFFVADLTQEITNYAFTKQTFNKILLDPSRAGAAEILHHLKHWNPDKILYISCNPSTLARDAGILVHTLGYKLVKAGVMDMFPQTAHVESIALFER